MGENWRQMLPLILLMFGSVAAAAAAAAADAAFISRDGTGGRNLLASVYERMR